jgi:hypothetical protein
MLSTIYEAAEITWRDKQAEFLSEFFAKTTSIMSQRSADSKQIEAPAPQSLFETIHQQFETKYYPEFYLSLFECMLTFELALEHNLCIRDALDWTLAYMFRDDFDGSEPEDDPHTDYPLADD